MIEILMVALATEAITEIITSSEITFPIRNKIKSLVYNPEKPPTDNYIQNVLIFVDKILSCGYCCSVWVSSFTVIFLPLYFSNFIINWFILTFVVHRLSNLLHVIYELIKKGRVSTFDILLKKESEENGTY